MALKNVPFGGLNDARIVEVHLEGTPLQVATALEELAHKLRNNEFDDAQLSESTSGLPEIAAYDWICLTDDGQPEKVTPARPYWWEMKPRKARRNRRR